MITSIMHIETCMDIAGQLRHSQVIYLLKASEFCLTLVTYRFV